MRELSPRIAWYALLSVLIALILGACVQPVALKPFLGDDKVQGLIKNGPHVEPGYENPGIEPELKANGVAISADGIVPLSGSSMDITVTNYADYDSIEWWCDGDSLNVGISLDTGKADTYMVSTSVAPFNVAGVYSVTVTGTTEGVPCSTLFYIKVEQ